MTSGSGSGSESTRRIRSRGWARIGGVEVGARIEVERGLRWYASGGEGWRAGSEAEVLKGWGEAEGVAEEGDDPHLATAVGAEEREALVDAGDELDPAGGGGRRVGYGRGRCRSAGRGVWRPRRAASRGGSSGWRVAR